MTLRKRRILFYMLFLVFIVAGPILVANSFGYNIDFVSGDIRSTGGIFVKSTIPRIAIYLNGELQKETSIFSRGALLTDLVPGEYLLEIKKSGFRGWSKIVKVKPGLVEEFRNILLVPEKQVFSTTTPATIKMLGVATTTIGDGFLKIDENNNLIKISRVGSSTILMSNVNSFTVINGEIVAVGRNGFLARVDPETGDIRIVGRPGFYLSEKPLRFIPSPRNNKIAIIDPVGGFYMLTEDKVYPLEGGVKKAVFDAKGKKLFLLKRNIIEILWIEDSSTQPFHKKGDLETVLTTSFPILDAAWFYADNFHIVFRQKGGILITELDGRGTRNIYTLWEGNTDELFTSPLDPNSIFFKKDGVWHQIKL